MSIKFNKILLNQDKKNLERQISKIQSAERQGLDISNKQVFNEFYILRSPNYAKNDVFKDLIRIETEKLNQFLIALINSHIIRLEACIKEIEKYTQVVSTNPLDQYHVGKTNTFDIVLKIISSAKKEIILIGFDFTLEKHLDVLKDKLRKGVRLIIIGEEDFVQAIREYLETTPGDVKFYQFEKRTVKDLLGKKKTKYSKFHAKVIMADQKWGLLSSANLTYSGFTCNVEIGTVIQKDQCIEIFRFMNELIQGDVIKQFIPYY